MQPDMNEHEEIAKALKARLSELRTHLAKVDRSLHKLLPADSEDQAIELENQEALEVIKKTETKEIHQIEAALNRDSSDEPKFDVDSSEFPGCSKVPPPFVAVRRQSGSGAAFLGRSCLFFLGIWAQSSRRLLLNA